MLRVGLVFFWFIATFFVLLTSTGLLYSRTKNLGQGLVSSAQIITQSPPNKLFTALPAQIGGLTNSVLLGDARPLILKNFLELNRSPLAPYHQLLVATADKYGLDFRLIPSIAMVESTGGKVMPARSHNAWGFANGATKFNSWEEAIEKVAQTLRVDYIDQGLSTPELIMPKYAPPSVAKGGPWAKGVTFFFEELE